MTRSEPASRLAPSLVLGLLVALSAHSSSAQQHPNLAQGFQPDHLYQFGDLDHVNLFNGNLTVLIPLGTSYPVGGGFSYQLVLTYTGNVWDFETTWDLDGYDRLEAFPRKSSNAGLGWQLSLGAIGEGGGYRSPDGAVHELRTTLHTGGRTDAGYTYTTDGTFLRFNTNVTPNLLESPDGTRRYFSGGKLTQISDRFGNSLTISYVQSATYPQLKDWKLTDSQGRVQWIYFRPPPSPVSLYSGGIVDRVVLTPFGGGSGAVYTFSYSATSITRGLSDPSLSCQIGSRTETVPLLSSVSRPDGTAFGFTYDPGPYHTACSSGTIGLNTDSRSGHLLTMTLPTRGKVVWQWGEYLFPQISEHLGGVRIDPSNQWMRPFSRPVGVTSRSFVGADGVTQGTWTYQHGLDVGQIPNRQGTTTLTNPLGHTSVYYFSIYACQPVYSLECPSQDPDPGGWSYHDYGLPFTRNTTDATGTRFLSSEIHNGAAGSQVERKTYLRYESSGYGLNPRLASQRTIYVTDGNRYADIDSTDFDGLGHYRTVATAGNFDSGNSRTVTTHYNPGSCATCTPLTTTPWVLETYDYQTTTEGTTAKVETCFNSATGFLQYTRVLKTGTTRGTTDLIQRFSKDGAGNVTAEETFGGDNQAVGTGSLCSLSLPATADHRVDHTYLYGSLRTSQASGMPFKMEDFDIDLSTGLVKTSRDVAGLSTTYLYDSTGRLTDIRPAQDGWTNYTYTNASGTSTPAKVKIYRRSNGGATNLAQEEVQFDPFGRVAVERKLLPDGSWSDRKTYYNALGWVTARTEWGTAQATTYSNYDAFGRPDTIKPPDGTSHNVTLQYSGARVVVRTVKVGTAWNGSSVTEAGAITTETYDRQGRLYKVNEPANPDGTNSTTTYGYDVGGRLKTVTQVAKTATGVNTTQTRTFTYDNRGFLSSESHPEKGAAGNGTVTYSGYNSQGQPGQILDGPNSLTYSYDAAGRVTQVRESGSGFLGCVATWTTGPKCLEVFTYATANGASDYRLGKLQTASRYNYPVIGTTTYTAKVTETMVYGGKQGRVSSRDTSQTTSGSTPESFTQSWVWNDLGNVASTTYPRCTHAACTAGTVRTVSATYTNGFLTAVPGYASPISYHPNGQVNQVTHLNTASNSATWVTDTYAKDANNLPRPASINAKLGANVLWSSGAYAYDGSGNVVKAGSSYYLYDKVSRILSGIQYTGPGGGATGPNAFSHTYDGFGNLQALTTLTTRNTPTSSSTNRLTGSVIYDSAGNLTSWNGATYAHDRFNQMWHMVNGSEDWLYLYDASGERIWSYKTSINTSRWTLRDLDGKVLREYQNAAGTWSVQKDYVYRGSQLIAAQTSTGVTHFHLDHLGTVRAVTNSAGTRIAYHAYFPFGEEATSATQDTERMKFTGHERDLGNTSSTADDLDYMHARFYNPQLGRFVSTDPANSAIPGKPQSWNQYGYALENPVSIVDPNGQNPVLILVALGVAGGLIFGAEPANTPTSDHDPNVVRGSDGMKAVAASSTVITIVKAGMEFLGIGHDSGEEVGKPEPKEGSAGEEGAGMRFSEKTKDAAREEAGNRCVFCGRETTREPGGDRSNIDHSIPRSRGGDNTQANAQNTCQNCNQDKGTMTTEEYMRAKREKKPPAI